jgi:hypothetical protein
MTNPDKSASLTFEQIQEEYNNFIDDCANLNIFTRSMRLQEAKITEIQKFIARVKGFKAQMINRNDEYAANIFFHYQCMLRAMESSLGVWVAIKSEDFTKAWHQLVDAQEYKDVALKIADYPGLRNFETCLQQMENILFPHWSVYNSAGFSESVGNCSICSNDFGKCNHIENFIYMGKLCRRVDRRFIEAHHSAIVKKPRDKRCIITKMSNDNEKMVDRFTLEEVGEKKEKTDAMIMEGILFSTVSLDFD